MAEVELAVENFAAALELAQRALAIDPTLRPAVYTTGVALQGMGRDADARAFLVAGAGSQPRWLWDPLTEEMLSYRLTTSGLTERARVYFTSADYARATDVYERLLKRKPDDPACLRRWRTSRPPLPAAG
jgi:tetratricopeptide (TPR) repeat protein